MAIHGLGGQGKTQLALAYHWNYRDTYSATFWIKAETREQIDASYHTIAKKLRSVGLLENSHSPGGDLGGEVDQPREWFEGTSESREY